MVQCNTCQKPFARTSTLKRHVYTQHSDAITRLKCPKCNRSFVRADHWRRHYEDLHGDGRKACPTCLREFRQDYLKQHQSICKARSKLPGQAVVLNSGSSRGDRPVPEVLDLATLQQRLEASFEPDHGLQMHNESTEMPESTPVTTSESNKEQTSPESAPSLLACPEEEIDGLLELSMDEYAEIIETLRHEGTHYDKNGRVSIESWPLTPEAYVCLSNVLPDYANWIYSSLLRLPSWSEQFTICENTLQSLTLSLRWKLASSIPV